MGDRKVTFGNRADLNKVASLMEVVEAVRDGDVDKARGIAINAGLPGELVDTLVGLGGVLDELVEGLDRELLYDEYNPRLYYL